MLRTTTRVFLYVALTAMAVPAQADPRINVFFGFDFILHPIAIKWACGGERSQDLAAIETLIAAFPQDAESADLQGAVDRMLQVSDSEAALAETLGGELPKRQTEELCAAARPLSIVWATPEHLTNGNEDEVPSDRSAAWAEFYRVVENLQ